MATCPNCGYPNRPGTILCDDCGHSFHANMAYHTRLNRSASQPLTPLDTTTPGATNFPPDATLILLIANTPIELALQPGESLLLGRATPTNTGQPDFDLTPYEAQDLGVSRIHATLGRSRDGHTIILADLDSANGTYLNHHPLPTRQPVPLHHTDTIHLGKFPIQIQFQTP